MLETNVVKAMKNTLSQLENGVHNPEGIANSLLQSEISLSNLEQYKKYLPEYVLENAASENAVSAFLDMTPVLDGSAFKTALKNEKVSIDYIQLVIKKMEEECLQIACKQETSELLNVFLEKDRALANFKLLNGSYILHYAMQHCCTEDIVRSLLWYGAVPEAEDLKGLNILHYAALNPSEELWEIFSQKPEFSKYLKRADSEGLSPQEFRKLRKSN